MPDYAPAEWRDRVWHIETDADGVEHLHYNGFVMPSNGLSLAGTAGFPDEEVDRARSGNMRYTEVRPAAYNAKARLQDMDTDGIDLAVLYPTSMLGLQSLRRRGVRSCAGARLQRLGVGPHPGGRGSAVRGGRGAADERRRRRAGGCRRDPARRREAGHGVGVPASEPVGRLAAVQRQGLRPGVAGRGRDRARARVPPVPHARPSRCVPRAEAGAAVRERELRAVGGGARRAAGR